MRSRAPCTGTLADHARRRRRGTAPAAARASARPRQCAVRAQLRLSARARSRAVLAGRLERRLAQHPLRDARAACRPRRRSRRWPRATATQPTQGPECEMLKSARSAAAACAAHAARRRACAPKRMQRLRPALNELAGVTSVHARERAQRERDAREARAIGVARGAQRQAARRMAAAQRTRARRLAATHRAGRCDIRLKFGFQQLA